jgi:tetratricopeptide (TPR) repeat protein
VTTTPRSARAIRVRAAAGPRLVPMLLLLIVSVPAQAPPARADHLPAEPATARGAAARPVPLFDGLGRHRFATGTKNARAARYIDQGLVLHYAFNHEEAIRSFEQAARLDPRSAIAWWGVALAHGPNINLPMDDAHGSSAAAAISRAQALAKNATPRERAYIAALARRYERGGARGGLDTAYVDAMRELSRAYPDDLDAATLFAEALMNLRPWDHWTKQGTMQPGTEELLAVLDRVLARDPDHPGANHFYIHAIEASPTPEKALPMAGRLRTLVPAAGHLVHMPAHVYMRTGRYHDAAAANQQAATADSVYVARTGAEGVYTMMYYPHNVHFLWASLALGGRSGEALAAARRAAGMLSAEVVAAMPMAEFVPPTPYFAHLRFGRWEAMLAEPAPPAAQRYVTGMWHYGRGVALAETGRAEQARAASDSLEAIAAATDPAFMVDINSAKVLLELAGEVLTARLARAAGRADEAILHFERAVAKEDGLRYSEPPAWYHPSRQMLGQALLDAGRGADAERVFREDLVHYPENGWSLFGLERALALQGRADEARAAGDRFTRAWSRADVRLERASF